MKQSVPTAETLLWQGSTAGQIYNITILAGVTVLKIQTDDNIINSFVYPSLPIYVGVTPGKTYPIRYAYVETGVIPEPEYWEVGVQRFTNASDWKTWIRSSGGDDIEGSDSTNLWVQFYYSASINNITPSVTDY